jgi:phage tail tape-measure protein
MDEFFSALIGFLIGNAIGDWLFGEKDDKRDEDDAR